MAKKSNLTKSKSLYTIKKRHSTTNNGIIYENDHFTIIPNDGIFDNDDEGTIYFSNSNFKYKFSLENNGKKRHVRGSFIKNNDDSEVWTLDTISAHTNTSNDSKIIIKPNYSSIKDFAYYGSAVELVKATVQDIIKRFPGGLSYYSGDDIPTLEVGGKTYYLISNEFKIDCWTYSTGVSEDVVKSPMRILSLSYMNYVDKDGNTCDAPSIDIKSTCLDSIIGTVTIAKNIFYIYMNGKGEKYLVTLENGSGVIIKPKQKYIDEFWENIDDFERVLLNRETTPIYKAVFETPYLSEDGYYYTNKSYIWPTVGNDGFTPDLTSAVFQGYLTSLLSLAEFHDEYDSDNIWRMMTHESIKNLDWTHTSYSGENSDENSDEYSDFDTKGIGAMMRVYGRQFDDIKRYADNIKYMNTISYDEKNNMPDYFLSDIVEQDGWESKNIQPYYFDDSINYKNINSIFLRRLALSSKYIHSLKGTRRGIEAILGMFGYEYDLDNSKSVGTYTIDEYVMPFFSGLSYYESYRLRGYYENVSEVETAIHFMDGFPVALIPYSIENEDGKIDNKDYLVPWHVKNKPDMYFQSKGGWGKFSERKINLLNTLTTATTITSDGKVQIYNETQPYMKYANTIDEMLMIPNSDLYENIICYVADISNIKNEYVAMQGDETDDYSHYFSLKNIALSTRCGFVSNSLYNCYGWKNITSSEIMDCNTNDGKRVVYLESLISECNGNNPHVGYGKYDDGESYIENFTNIFGELFKRGVFDFVENEDKKDYETLAKGYGFKTDGSIIDNKKCAFFLDYNDEAYRIENNLPILVSYNGIEDVIENWNSKNAIDAKITFPNTPDNVKNVADETQSNGIMNLKNIVINFNVGGNEFLKEYIQTVVFKYLESMIPSTAILEYRFDNKTVYAFNEMNFNNGSFNVIRTAHAYIKNEENVTVWKEYPTPINEM